MKIDLYRVKQYSAKSVTVICVDGKPFCTARGQNTMDKIIARLNGRDVILQDGLLQNKIDNYLGIRK